MPLPEPSISDIQNRTNLEYLDRRVTNLSNVVAAGGGGGGAVTSVAGKTGAVTLTKSDVGLSNVDNTSDANKPISTATQTALNAKVGTTGDESIAGVKTFENIAVGTNPELTAGSNNVSINADTVGITAGSSLQFSGAPPAFAAMGLYPNEAYAFNPGVAGGEILSSFLGGLYFLEPGTACTVYLRFDEAPFGLIIVRNDGAANLTLDIDPTSALTMPATATLTPGTFATFTPDHMGAIRRIN